MTRKLGPSANLIAGTPIGARSAGALKRKRSKEKFVIVALIGKMVAAETITVSVRVLHGDFVDGR